MKYIVILGDGMADCKIEELGNKTPLQVARKTNMDKLAKESEIGMVKTVPEDYPPGSDVANLSVMGYNPENYYTGRSPLEAVSMGVDMGGNDVSFRCNLVTLSDEDNYHEKTMMDYSSGEISTEEAAELIKSVNESLANEEFKFYPGVSYRHLLVWNNGPEKFDLTPPHDISDKKVGEFLPKGMQSEKLLSLMEKSSEILADHPINKDRVARGLNPATSIWLWGEGKKPALNTFDEKYGLKGSVVSAVDLTKGLGICAGLDVVNVPGATGNVHTNFKGKAEAAIKELENGKDFVYVHVEAPDEAGHQGSLKDKIKSIEEIDETVLGTILCGLEQFEHYRIMILPDHPTPLSIKTHTADPVPYLIYDSKKPVASGVDSYTEENAESTGVFVSKGYELMDKFIKN